MALADLQLAPRPRFLVDVPARELPLIKQVPGARFDRGTSRWVLPLNWATAKQLRGVFRDHLQVTQAVADWSWPAREQADRVTTAQRAALDPNSDTLGDRRLYPFQRTGVEFLRTAEAAILADDLGTGKTVQSLTAVEHWPLLIVTPKSVKGQWAKEVETWTGGKAYVLDGGVAARRKTLDAFTQELLDADAVGAEPRGLALVVNWDQLRAHSRLAGYGSVELAKCEDCGGTARPASCEVHPRELNQIAWGTVIADEAHKAKAPKAKQTRALWALGDKAHGRFALTGTPLESSPLDFWSLLRFVAPEEWSSRSRFTDRYCLKEFDFFGNMQVKQILPDTRAEFDELVALRFLRRPKDLVAPWLPRRVSVRRPVEMSPKQAKAYKTLAEDFVTELDNGGEVVALTDLSMQARLLQLSSAMLEETEDGGVRMVEPSPKLDEFENVLAELGESPCAVFSSSRQLLRLAEARLEKAEIPFRVIAGDVDQAGRDEAREAYNTGRVRVLLVSLGAGAEGLNLTRGSTEIFLDRAWSYLQNKQAEDRMHGIGRGDKDAEQITIIDIVTSETLDEGRANLFAEKGELAEDLLRDKDLIRRMVKGKIE